MSLAIDVCVCTYRRATLADTLRSIAVQTLPAGVQVRVVVADNDDSPSASQLVSQTSAELGLDCLYIHAPARNISIARNACLDAATAPLLAFIDDDEVAADFWLANLIKSQDVSGVTITFGPVKAIYQSGPAWLRSADLHSIKPVIRRNGVINTGYTSNVLINRKALAEALTICRFDPALGRSGGEDSAFFHTLYTLGARFGFCPDAAVNEIVTPHRANLGWLVKRSFRSGQTHCRMLMNGHRWRLSITAVAAVKFGYSIAAACLWAPSAPAWRRYLVRGALHAGVVAKSVGLRDLQLY